MSQLKNRLAKACRENDIKGATAAVEAGASLDEGVDYEDLLQWPPLVDACEHDSFEVAELLIAKGANVNGQCKPTRAIAEVISEDGMTALLAAMHRENSPARERVVRQLLERGAIPDLSTKGGDVPIMACREDALWAIELFLRSGSKAHMLPGSSVIHRVAGVGALASLKRIIADGVSVNARSEGGGTPILNAANWLRYEVVEYLLSLGADINVQNSNGSNPLHLACDRASRIGAPEAMTAAVKTISILLKNNAKVDSKDCFKKTPIMYLKESQCQEAIQAFRAFGYNENDAIHRVKPQYLRYGKY